MASGSKMSELQDAMNRYGETSIRNYNIVHPIGEKIIEGFSAYLGEAGCVFGVPPKGDWQDDGRDYQHAKFSTYWEGTLKVDIISMGLCVRIPHTKDKGSLSLRLVLGFLVKENEFSVKVDDGRTIEGLPLISEQSDLQALYDEIFAYTKGTFSDPVNYHNVEKIGFVVH
jgi:hypothetical protein